MLVLSIAVPATTPSGNLDQALLELLPNAIAFALTVFIVVLYWHNHNEFFESFRGIDLPMIWLGIIYLALIALIPFPNGLLGNFPGEPLSYIVFATLLTGLAAVDTGMLVYANKKGLLKPQISRKTYRLDLARGIVAIATFAVSVPLSLFLVQLTPIVWFGLLALDWSIIGRG